MPNAPKENHQQNSFQVPPEKSDAHHGQKQRRQNEAPLKALEQGPIAVGAYHAWQVMTHGTERSDKQIDVLRTPLRLGQRESRYQQKWRTDVQDQVPPGTEYP